MAEVFALFVHGVGEQPASFAAEARHNLRAACAARGHEAYTASAHWAPLADRYQKAFLKQVEQHGSRGNLTQKLVVGTLSDALMYCRNAQLREQIWYCIDEQVARLRGSPIVAVCHSLGALAFTDYLRSRRGLKGVRLITLGCNIGLFNLGMPFEPVPGLASWVNAFDSADMLGFPLTMPGVRDVKVNVGSIFTRWNGLAHTAYWNDRKLFKKTIPDLLGL